MGNVLVPPSPTGLPLGKGGGRADLGGAPPQGPRGYGLVVLAPFLLIKVKHDEQNVKLLREN